MHTQAQKGPGHAQEHLEHGAQGSCAYSFLLPCPRPAECWGLPQVIPTPKPQGLSLTSAASVGAGTLETLTLRG